MRIPDDAFETYVAMGAGRSYQALAQKLGVDKRSVVRHAAREQWKDRIAKIHEEARAATDRKLVGELQAVRERQLQQARFLQGQALKAMKDLSPKDAVKIAAALNIGWKHELLLLGDPTERSEVSVEEVTRREIQTLLTVVDEGGETEDPFAEEGVEDDVELVESVEATVPPLGSDPNSMPLFPRSAPTEDVPDFVDLDGGRDQAR